MRIISKVRDFYDCGQAYGQDPELIYLRRPDEYVLLAGDPWIDRLETLRETMPVAWQNPTINRFIIGFCGKAYPGYRFTWSGQDGPHFRRMERILYYPDDFKDVFRFKPVQKAFPNFFKKTKRQPVLWVQRQMRNTNFEALVHTHEANFGTDEFYDLFIEMNSPIWIWDPSDGDRFRRARRKGGFLKINDKLQPYDFVRVLDPYTAYQELSMFVGNDLQRAEPIMASVSDASMLKKKGFHEYSFKTRPKEDKP